MKTLLKKLSRDERGVSALEYAILAGVIVAAVAAALASFGTDLTAVFDGLLGKVKSEAGITN